MTEPTNTTPDTPEPPEEPTNGRRFLDDLSGIDVDWRGAVLVPALAILTALIVSGIIILVTDIEVWRNFGAETVGNALREVRDAFRALFEGSFGSLRAVSETFTSASPLILAGLSVAIGFRAGLFNIGTEGQILVGGMLGLWVGFTLDLPGVILLPLVLAAAALGGAIWGGIPGWLRAKTGAHEVITTIMMNNIAGLLVIYLLTTTIFQIPDRNDPISQTISQGARFPRLFGFLDDPQIRIHLGIIFAVVVAYGIYWLLFKSTIGFEFRAVGFNPHAAQYAGMSTTRIYIAVMAVAGALGGLAGADIISGVLYRGTPGFSAGIGFDAISLALLGRSHPAGVVLAGIRRWQWSVEVPLKISAIYSGLLLFAIIAARLPVLDDISSHRRLTRLRTMGHSLNPVLSVIASRSFVDLLRRADWEVKTAHAPAQVFGVQQRGYPCRLRGVQVKGPGHALGR